MFESAVLPQTQLTREQRQTLESTRGALRRAQGNPELDNYYDWENARVACVKHPSDPSTTINGIVVSDKREGQPLLVLVSSQEMKRITNGDRVIGFTGARGSNIVIIQDFESAKNKLSDTDEMTRLSGLRIPNKLEVIYESLFVHELAHASVKTQGSESTAHRMQSDYVSEVARLPRVSDRQLMAQWLSGNLGTGNGVIEFDPINFTYETLNLAKGDPRSPLLNILPTRSEFVPFLREVTAEYLKRASRAPGATPETLKNWQQALETVPEQISKLPNIARLATQGVEWYFEGDYYIRANSGDPRLRNVTLSQFIRQESARVGNYGIK